MTKIRPSSPAESATGRLDYLPAAGRDAFLPFYDLFTAVLGAAKIHRALIARAQLADGQQVLEIGCGTGNLSLRAKRSQPGIRLIGSDPDPRALALAERKARKLDGVRFERAYAQRLPYSDATFDRVLSALMLHHLDQDSKVAAAAEVQRVLRPGGSLHLVDFTAQAHGTHGLQNLHGLLSRRVLKSGHLAENDGESIRQLLTAAGLECTQAVFWRHPLLGQVAYYQATRPR
jgi:ubiquinone/menaquinone biosynthesis C-methylase UbiE